MKLIFYFLFILILTNLASASLNIDKGKLYFNLNPGEESCQSIKVSSNSYEGKVNIRDIWAETFDEEGNFRKYTFTAKDHGLNIRYDNKIDNFNKESSVEVCLNGNYPGEYKGAMIFTPESDTNVVVEVGTWLLVNITGTGSGIYPSNPKKASQGGSLGSQQTEVATNPDESSNLDDSGNNLDTNYKENGEDDPDPGMITGAVVAAEDSPGHNKILWILIIIVVLFAAIIFIYKRKSEI